MKNKYILFIAILFTLSACKEEPKYYAVIYGKIKNASTDSLIYSKSGKKTIIKLNEDGTFRDTLKAVEVGSGSLNNGKYGTALYLKNGFDIKITADARDFENTVKFEGIGEESSTFLAEHHKLLRKRTNDSDLYTQSRDKFDAEMNRFQEETLTLLENTKNLDSTFIVFNKNNQKGLMKSMYKKYNQANAGDLLNGKSSPKFVDYINYAGGTTSLDDLKGKYVYIDLWATWCKPCIAEIPYLKKLEKEYHGKNINFVSISVDKKKDGDKWKAFVKDNHLTGTQLWSQGDKAFGKAYYTSGIPKFILIDPEGNIVEAAAPRPSDPKLKDILENLDL